MEPLPDIYPLTSFQIGDMQSYLSRVFLYFAPVSNKLLILVDSMPGLMKKHRRSTQIWQLMVTKSRMSPFKNTRILGASSSSGSVTTADSFVKRSSDNKQKLSRWFSVIDAAKWQHKSLFCMLDLCKTLHGFIVFEVNWKDVHGINYFNELQTDTSLALEVKSMKKWDFDSIDEALSCLSSWFMATPSETQSLQEHLKRLSNMDTQTDSYPDLSAVPKGLSFHDTSLYEASQEYCNVQERPIRTDNCDSGKQIMVDDSIQMDKFDIDSLKGECVGTSKELEQEPISKEGHCVHRKSTKCMTTKESDIEDIASMQYRDKLLLFRFSDGILPFKLKQIITSDLRLLTLLESGLPSWVIFFQSYPIFCQMYKPWMRPLARTLYILISLVTVIIGFYDLYKNVPLLKATAASLCGPLFEWIEAWEMVSRLRYLGTMLFLQNIEKAVEWFLMMMRIIKPLASLITKPFMEPLMDIVNFVSPVWNMISETVELMMKSSCSLIADLVEVLFSPFELLYSYILATAMSILPILSSIWGLFLVPIRFGLTLANYMATLLSNVYYLLKDAWSTVSTVTKLASLSGVKTGAKEVSIWHSLWKDLFSQVFRAIRSILHGFIAFATTCNRHRLSIYNHIRVFLWQLSRLSGLGQYTCSCQQTQQTGHHLMVDSKECNRCK